MNGEWDECTRCSVDELAELDVLCYHFLVTYNVLVTCDYCTLFLYPCILPPRL